MTGFHDLKASAASVDPWLGLAAAVMAKAAEDAQAGDLGAALWLAGEDAALFAQCLELDLRPVLKKSALWGAAPAGKIVIRLCCLGA